MSSSIRLYVTAPLAEGNALSLSPEQAHYLGKVMRRAVGDAVLLFNGRDGEFRASISRQARNASTVTVEAQTRPQSEERAGPWLLFAPLKRDATDLVARAATELGVSRLLPVITDRTQTARVSLARLTAIAIEAAEQCERLTVPAIDEPVRLGDVLGEWIAPRVLYAALERSRGDLAPVRHDGPVALLIGPEGGFSPEERARLRGLPFVRGLSLGERILRAETAAIAGLARLQACFRGMGSHAETE